MKFHIKKSRFSVKSRCKEVNGGGHSLNRDFTVNLSMFVGSNKHDD